MFNLLRKVSICLLLSMAFSNFILGQSYTDRLTARANEEKKILNYVNSNLAKTPSSVITTFKNNITTNEDHPHSYSQIEIDQMVEEAKKSYWRIQYFIDYPNAAAIFKEPATSDCANGDFEFGNFMNYSFESGGEGAPGGSSYGFNPNGECSYVNGTAPNLIAGNPGNANHFKIMDNTVTPNDPFVGIPTTNHGRYAARINSSTPCTAQFGVNMISRTFLLSQNKNEITFSYALVLQNPFNHDKRQPVFIARVLNQSGVEIDRICHVSNQNDPFFKKKNISVCVDNLLVYSDWLCANLKINGKTGETYTLEIYQTDCGAGAHFGYAYVDDICEACVVNPCNNTGDVDLFPTDSCFDREQEFKVCGKYELPVIECKPGVYDSLKLYVIKNGIQTLLNIPPSRITVNTTTREFCIQLIASDFPSMTSGYDFKVDVFFTINGGIHIETDYHTNPGIHNDIVFHGNCTRKPICWILDIIKDNPPKPVDPKDPTTFVNPFLVPTLGQGGTALNSFIMVEGLNRTLTKNEAWMNKVYVADNVIIRVPKGKTLDLTNVDIIFGECAGLFFEDGSMIRANNSVFRPCNYNYTWLGFSFTGKVTGIIDECIFKNAQIALNIFGAQEAYVRIVNNLFENCRYSIRTEKSTLYEGISGNTFNIDKNEIVYKTECPNAIIDKFDAEYTGNHFGIWSNASRFIGNVSQNDFINIQEYAGKGTMKKLYAISAFEGTYGVYSKNTFTNAYRSFDIGSCFGNVIENNTIEVNSLGTYDSIRNEYQIRISGSSDVSVNANQIKYFNKNDVLFPPLFHAAIYLEKTQAVKLLNNSILGFATGIQSENNSNLLVSDNTLSKITNCAVYMVSGNNNDVLCNSIDLNDKFKTDRIGIRFISNDENSSTNRMSSNCITNASTSILLQSQKNCIRIPMISNNFLFNYTQFGIDIEGFEGNIGEIGNARDGGRNTFASNSLTTGAIDIRTTCPVAANGNFGVIVVAGPVVVGYDDYYSTASCAKTIPLDGIKGLSNSYNETCDPTYFFEVKDLMEVKSNYLVINTNALEKLMDRSDYLLVLENLFNTLATNNISNQELTKVYNATEKLLENAEKKYLEYLYAKYTRDFDNASKLLALLPSLKLNIVSPEWVSMEELALNLIKNGKLPANLLQGNLNDRLLLGRQSDLYNSLFESIDYPFNPILELKSYTTNPKVINQTLTSKLQVSPNPVNDVLKVSFNLSTKEVLQLRVFNTQGVMVKSVEVDFKAGVLDLDVEKFVPGIYFIEISSIEGAKLKSKFIKL